MDKKGFISAAQKAAALSAPLTVLPPSRQNYAGAPYFVDYVKETLEQEGDDLTPSADLRGARALRQPGSTFKPFVYAAALQKGGPGDAASTYTLSSLMIDEPCTFHFHEEEYTPRNYDEKYYGPVTLRQALARSLNIPTVKLAQQVGFDSVAAFARQFGFGESLLPYPSMALGTFDVTLMDLARGYAVFANGGRAVPIRTLRALQSDGTQQEIPADKGQRVLRPEVAFLITSAMESVLNEGTGASARARGFRMPAAGKTGTSDDDSWYVGYTPDLLCAVWVGLDDSSPLHLTGARAALPVWTLFMQKAQRLGYLSGASFSPPQNVVAVSIDPRTGLLASDRCEEIRVEFYVKGTEPLNICSHDDEKNLANLVQDPGAPREKEKKKGFWGWLKRVFK